MRLRAAEGWLELGDAVSASDELEEISAEVRANPAVLSLRYSIYAKEKRWDMAAEVAEGLTAEEQLILKHTTRDSHVIVMLDENEAGQAGREDIACRLSKHCFVRVHEFDTPNAEPEHLSPEALQDALGGAP